MAPIEFGFIIICVVYVMQLTDLRRDLIPELLMQVSCGSVI